MSTVVSLFDESGRWPLPWAEAGFRVVSLDIRRGPHEDVFKIDHSDYDDVSVVLAAPPCTALTRTSARWRDRYDDAYRDAGAALVRRTLELIEAWQPKVWAIENPPGLIHQLVPALAKLGRYSFQPWEFAGWLKESDPSIFVKGQDLRDRYSKRTNIWGRFVTPRKKPIERLDDWDGQTAISWVSPGPDRASVRSRTPLGFARAFFAANLEMVK